MTISRRRRATILAFAFTGTTVALWAGLGASQANAVDFDSIAPRITTTDCGDNYSAQTIVPAAGFNALTATAAELTANGLPQRPISASDLAQWSSFVTGTVQSAASCDDLISVPITDDQPGGPVATSAANSSPGDSTPTDGATPDGVGQDVSSPDSTSTSKCLNTVHESCNWAGNYSNNDGWTQAEATWTVPTAKGPDTSASSQWVGVGQGNNPTYPLYQAGSEVDDAGAQTYVWIETYPEENQIKQFSIAAGHKLGVHVAVTSTGATYHIDDETAGKAYSYTYTGVHNSDGSAEWIDERTEKGNHYDEYADQNTTFSGAEAYSSSSGWTKAQSTAHSYYNMFDCGGTQLGGTGSITNGDTYTVSWKAYGTVDPENCGS